MFPVSSTVQELKGVLQVQKGLEVLKKDPKIILKIRRDIQKYDLFKFNHNKDSNIHIILFFEDLPVFFFLKIRINYISEYINFPKLRAVGFD